MGRGCGIDNRTLVQNGLPFGGRRTKGSYCGSARKRSAKCTRSAKEEAAILPITLARCTFTVRSAAPRSAAICLFSCPATTASKTCRSRALSEYRNGREASPARSGRDRARACSLDGVLDRGEQGLALHGLGEEVRGPGFHRAHARGHVGTPGEENHGQRERRTCSAPLASPGRSARACCTSRTRQPCASGPGGSSRKSHGRCVPAGFVARGAFAGARWQLRKDSSSSITWMIGVVVALISGALSRSGTAVPGPPRLGWAQMRPPWASTIERAMDSPRPMPWGLVLKNESKS